MDFFLPKESLYLKSGYSYFIIKLFNYLDHFRRRGAIAAQTTDVWKRKVDDPLGTNYLVVCCDVGQLTFESRF